MSGDFGSLVLMSGDQIKGLKLKPLAQSLAVNNSIFFNSNNSNKLSYKDNSGNILELMGLSPDGIIAGALNVSGNIVLGTDYNNTLNVNAVSSFSDQLTAQKLISQKEIILKTIDPNLCSNESILIDSNDGILKYKDNGGALHPLY